MVNKYMQDTPVEKLTEVTLQQLVKVCNSLPDPKEWRDKNGYALHALVETLSVEDLLSLSQDDNRMLPPEIIQFGIYRIPTGYNWFLEKPILVKGNSEVQPTVHVVPLLQFSAIYNMLPNAEAWYRKNPANAFLTCAVLLGDSPIFFDKEARKNKGKNGLVDIFFSPDAYSRNGLEWDLVNSIILK